MSITCIVPCRNHWEVTAKCLASIFKSENSKDIKVIVIDDCSTDYTPKLLKTIANEGYPLVVITHLKESLGYIKSTNDALKIVDTPYIVLMNNDVILDKDCLKNLLDTFKKYQDIGILGGTQLNVNREEMHPLKFFVRGENATIINHIQTSNIPDNLKNAEVIYCDDVHFACALTSKEVVDKVGLMDEQFGKGNYDQEDYVLQVKESHKQIAVCPKAKFIHIGSVSVSDNMPYFSQLLDRNRELFFKKWGEKLRKNLV